MKFKYNFLTNTLHRLEGEYSFEVNEENHFRTHQGTYGTDSFYLGAKETIIFTWETNQIKVIYQKQNITYQKILALPNTGEIIVEFNQENQI